MRTKELKPGTEYATAAGTLVVTGDTVERDWYSFRRRDPKTRQAGPLEVRRGMPDDKPTNDPWAAEDRHRGRPSKLEYAEVTEGVRATRYAVDRDGNRAGEGTDIVIDPKHIKGTWKQYLELHADKIRCKFEKADAEEAAKAESLRLRDMLSRAGVPVRGTKSSGETGAWASVSVEYRTADRPDKWTTWCNDGQAFLEYRLAPELSIDGEWAEKAIRAMLGEGA